MAKEIWTQYKPISNLQERYWVEDTGLTTTSFFIQLHPDKSKGKDLQLDFPQGVKAYRYTNESYCFTVYSELAEQFSDDYIYTWSFFKVTHSAYIHQFLQESGNISHRENLIHFAILGLDEIVDIIAIEEPTFTFIDRLIQEPSESFCE